MNCKRKCDFILMGCFQTENCIAWKEANIDKANIDKHKRP